MTVRCVAIAGYRSLHDLCFAPGPLTVITRIELTRDEDGATRIVGQGLLDRPAWP